MGTDKKIFYYLTRFFMRPFFKLFVGLKVKFPSNFSLKKPVIIASNHLSLLDGFIIIAGFSLSSRIHPLYFMVDDNWINGFRESLLRAWGGFPSYYGQGLEVSLREAKRLLRKRKNVLMFPQGERFGHFNIKEGKIGTAALSLTTNTPILPIKICDSYPGSLIKFFLGRRRIKILTGRPFYLSDRLNKKKIYTRSDFSKATEVIMKEIKRL